MRILFDQGTPVEIATFLANHTIRTTRQEVWETLANGDLLRAAEEAGFELLLSTDNGNRIPAEFEGAKNRYRCAQPQPLANGPAHDEENSGGG